MGIYKTKADKATAHEGISKVKANKTVASEGISGW
jgi:hypothetical protein